MKEGDIVLTALPQADGKTKLRPVLLLRQLPPLYNDYLVCGISTQLHQMIKDFDELISAGEDDFKLSGLVQESIFCLSFLAVMPINLIPGTVGKISGKRHQKILQRLSDYLLKK